MGRMVCRRYDADTIARIMIALTMTTWKARSDLDVLDDERRWDRELLRATVLGWRRGTGGGSVTGGGKNVARRGGGSGIVRGGKERGGGGNEVRDLRSRSS